MRLRERESSEVREARQVLEDLAVDSRAAIGGTAMKLFKELEKLPPAHNSPHNLPPHWGVPSGSGIHKHRRIVREAAVDATRKNIISEIRDPRLHPIEGYDRLSAVVAVAEFYRSYYYSESDLVNVMFGRSHFPLPRAPGYTRYVTLLMHHPDRRPTFFDYLNTGISTKGEVKDTYRPNSDYSTYDNPTELTKARVRDYSGRLAIAGLVAQGVESIYAIESDLSGLQALHADWSEISSELEPSELPFWAQHSETGLAHLILNTPGQTT